MPQLNLKRKQTNFSDFEYVKVIHDDAVDKMSRTLCENSLYNKLRRQFIIGTRNYNLIDDDELEDIFNRSYMIVWEGIRQNKISISIDKVMVTGRGGEQKEVVDLAGYFMRIVKNLYLEEIRKISKEVRFDDGFNYEPCDDYVTWEEDDNVRRGMIVRRCLKELSDTCREILTNFYYENKSLKEILEEREENSSYDGLKSSKHKCLKQAENKIRMELEKEHLNY